MVRVAVEVGLREPDFVQEDTFKVIIYRPSTDQVPTKLRPSTDQVPQELRSSSVEVRNLVIVLEGEMSRTEIQDALGLKHKGNFRINYIDPALESGFIELKYPDSPNHPKQKYKLTEHGNKLKKKL